MVNKPSVSDEEAPASAVWSALCRLSVLFAIAASAALYIQYLNPADAAFCGLSSGCEAVRRSGFSYFKSQYLSIPLVGLVAYCTVLGVSLHARSKRWTLILTAIGAACGVALILTQAFYVRAFCWLCLVVDTSGIAAALFAWLNERAVRAAKGVESVDPLRSFTWAALAVFAVAVPAVWANVKPAPPVPAAIRELYEPGKINVVEFADFECPYCRRLLPVLRHVMDSYPAERVRFLRKQVPLPVHEQARPAARADVCAAVQGKGEALADRLVQIELSPSAVRRAAVGVGVDVDAFDRCLASTEPDVQIDADTKLLQDAGMAGLPTTYVEGKRLLGAVPEVALRDAFDRAARGETESGVPGAVFVPLAVGLFLAMAWLGRSTHVKLEDERRV